MSIASNTLSAMQLFEGEIKDSFLLHIPHASRHIPDYTGFDLEAVEKNLACLTDWATDEIFNVGGVGSIRAPFSRIFCDVERFADAEEPLYAQGRGFFYTKGYDGSALRKEDAALKQRVFRDFYQVHHALLEAEVLKRLAAYGVCHILDCHAFNAEPIGSLLDHPASPDICIGTDRFHTPAYLLNHMLQFWTEQGFSVEINNPYSGCMIPGAFYRSDKNVKGIMLEINKRLYMDGRVDPEKVSRLNRLLQAFFDTL